MSTLASGRHFIIVVSPHNSTSRGGERMLETDGVTTFLVYYQ